MGQSARINELLIAFSRIKQADISTVTPDANLWSFLKLNADVASPKMNTETDEDEIGSGLEFPSNVYPVSWDGAGALDKFCSAEWAAFCFAFGLGKVVTTTPSTGVYKHTCTPLHGETDGIVLPYFTFCERVRTGANMILDHSLIGCVLSQFALTIGSGPGRANSKLSASFVGSGRHARPSGVAAWPVPQAVTHLLSGGASVVLNGTDYVASQNILSTEFQWNNDPRADSGFFPGSGMQEGAAVRGRMEYGKRTAMMTLTARADHSSTELQKLIDLTEGTAVITLTGANIPTTSTPASLKLTMQRVQFSSVDNGATDGIVDLRIGVRPLWHLTNGLLTAEIICGIPAVG